jgi:hypothetical protein
MKKTNIVLSRYNKNVEWVYNLKGNNNILIYDKNILDCPYNIPVNKGNEASVYLKYIVDHYYILTDFTFFIHDEEFSWHHSGSIIDKFDESIISNELYYNINDRNIMGSIFNLTKDEYRMILHWYSIYIEPYIPKNKLPEQDWTNGYRGSAQFLVHKSLIRKLPKKFYEDLYKWIITTDLPNELSGKFLEWTWHIFWDIYPKIE